jgi:hypothetical protein
LTSKREVKGRKAMTLDEKREDWEKGSKEVLCVTHNIDGFKVVYSITSKESKFFDVTRSTYRLLRYFKLGNNWEVSCDIEQQDVDGLMACLNEITTRFEDIRP